MKKTKKKIHKLSRREKYFSGVESFVPFFGIFLFLTIALTSASIWLGATEAKVPYRELKCKSGFIQYGLKCYGERTLLIQVSSETLAVLKNYFAAGVKFLPLVKIGEDAGFYGRVEGRNIFAPEVKNFNPLANNQYQTRVWQMNEVSRLAVEFYFVQFAEKYKLSKFDKMPAWFREGLYEWGAHSAFRRAAGKNLDAEIATISEFKLAGLVSYLKTLKDRGEVAKKFGEFSSWNEEKKIDASLGRDKYEAAAFYFVKYLADQFGKEKLRDFIIAAGNTGDLDGALFSIFSKNLTDLKGAVLASLDSEFLLYETTAEKMAREPESPWHRNLPMS